MAQLKQVLRRFGRAPGLTAIMLLTLGVGIGANSAIFSVVESILLKPLPYPHAEQLVAVWLTAPGLGIKDLNPSPADYLIDRDQSRVFQDIGFYTSFALVMLAIAGGMALLLGVVGLYGVIACSVSQRRREIGIRMALGARNGELGQMFVRQALVLAGLGAMFGLGVAPSLTRLMSSLLFGVKSVDPTTYGAVALGLVATAALASYVPARRAAGVSPVESLRAE